LYHAVTLKTLKPVLRLNCPKEKLMKKLLSISFAVLACAIFADFFLTASKAQISAPESSSIEARKQQNFSQLINTAREKGAARVIIGLKTEVQPEGTLRQAERARQLLKIKEDQSNFLNRHQAQQIDKVKQLKFIPFLAFEAKAEALERMQNDPLVLSIEEDALAEPTLAESTALVGATTSWASGFSGSGQAVAILDTGVDKNHPFLNGKIVAEGCYSSNYGTTTSVCPGGVEESTAPDSGVNCDGTISGCAHGTHVAGIVAGRGTNFSGAARDANIIAMQVFSRFNNATDCGTNPVPCALSYTSDQLRALERVLDLSSSMNIAAVNMSLGGGQYAASCDDTNLAYRILINNLRSVGIATVVSSGNSAYTNALSAPACVSTAISVGSTDDGSYGTGVDTVSNFSNSSSLLTILAPGRWIASSVPNGGYSNYSGTSMAAPHVAAAFAVLKQQKPNASVSQILNALTATGKRVTDSRNGITKSRIRIDQALNAIASRRAAFDYDGDGKADISVFRPLTGSWYISNSANGALVSQQFGIQADSPAAADFDGDGKTDIAVFRPAIGGWYVLNSSTNNFSAATFGANGDLPVPADYDGDGKADLAVYRPSNGTWWVTRSGNNAVVSQQHGTAEDQPTPGDFDGDGKADYAVFRPSNGYWYRLNSSDHQFIANQFGIAEDKPVPADFDGDGKTDLAVFRPSNGYWYVINSGSNSFTATQFGITEDKPSPADFDGDGKTDPAVFRPSTGYWYLLRTTAGFTGAQFGTSGDVPTPNAFIR
jgi:subtilisin family serine protease